MGLHQTLATLGNSSHAVPVTIASEPQSDRLTALGWTSFYVDQLSDDEASLVPMRVATVHRSRMTATTGRDSTRLVLGHNVRTTDFAVGDWVLVEPDTSLLVRRLDRHSLLQRRTEGGRDHQLIAANVDTLFIVTSCNDDFNPARLERYLALSNEAGTTPVIVLTKADQTTELDRYKTEAAAIQRDLTVVTVNGKSPDAAKVLAPWCGAGQTVALIGSSGVGKSTLLNTLADKAPDEAQATGGIRESDAKGRHTTTSRSLHSIEGGGWVIDTPGMRTLHVSDLSVGLDVLFAEIVEQADNCRFRNCTHAHEPGCAVQAAVARGEIDAARLDRWHKLQDENRSNTPVQTGPRGKKVTKPSGRRR